MKTCVICDTQHNRGKLTCSKECAAKYAKKVANAKRYTTIHEAAHPLVTIKNKFLLRSPNELSS